MSSDAIGGMLDNVWYSNGGYIDPVLKERLVKAIADLIILERIDELDLLNKYHSITDKDMANYIMSRKAELEAKK